MSRRARCCACDECDGSVSPTSATTKATAESRATTTAAKATITPKRHRCDRSSWGRRRCGSDIDPHCLACHAFAPPLPPSGADSDARGTQQNAAVVSDECRQGARGGAYEAFLSFLRPLDAKDGKDAGWIDGGGGGRRRGKQRQGRQRGSGVASAGGGRQRVEGTERGKQPLQPSEVAVRPERERLGQEPQRGDEAVPRPEGEGAAQGATAEAAGRSSATRGTTSRRCACAATCP